MPLPFASSSPVAARGFDPEGLARALLGPNASPDDIQRMLASIASAGPAGSAMAGHPEPDPEPDGDPDDAAYGYERDWTKGVARNTAPFGEYGVPPSLLAGATLAGAALPLAPMLTPALGAVGSGMATGAMGGAGTAMAFGDQDPASIGKKALGGALLGGAASKALPAAAGALEQYAPGLMRGLSNTSAANQAYARLGGELSMADNAGALSLVPKWQQVNPEESALLRNQPVFNAPPIPQSEPGLSKTFPSSSPPGLSLDPYKQPVTGGWRVDASQVPKWQAPADPTPSLGSVGPIDPSREADLLRNMPVRLETTAAMRPPPQFPPPGQGTMPLPGAVTGPTEDVDMEALMRALGLSR